ncbi:unnamed protein product [Durusdinium trenchii]|uniref:Uncharacterized protein n=2 Tax=Durusdinium trenchii TaxID=1381693 RepID=A0ABP0L095_9DINO
MQAAALLWLLPSIVDCHWQTHRSRSLKWNISSAEHSLLPRVQTADQSVNATLPASTWLCSKGSWLLQVMSLGTVDVQGRAGPVDPCLGGFTKFFWATLLAMTTLLGICLLIPVMLDITRRRPPGVPLMVCGITCDCEPKQHADEIDFFARRNYEQQLEGSTDAVQ